MPHRHFGTSLRVTHTCSSQERACDMGMGEDGKAGFEFCEQKPTTQHGCRSSQPQDIPKGNTWYCPQSNPDSLLDKKTPNCTCCHPSCNNNCAEIEAKKANEGAASRSASRRASPCSETVQSHRCAQNEKFAGIWREARKQSRTRSRFQRCRRKNRAWCRPPSGKMQATR